MQFLAYCLHYQSDTLSWIVHAVSMIQSYSLFKSDAIQFYWRKSIRFIQFFGLYPRKLLSLAEERDFILENGIKRNKRETRKMKSHDSLSRKEAKFLEHKKQNVELVIYTWRGILLTAAGRVKARYSHIEPEQAVRMPRDGDTIGRRQSQMYFRYIKGIRHPTAWKCRCVIRTQN